MAGFRGPDRRYEGIFVPPAASSGYPGGFADAVDRAPSYGGAGGGIRTDLYEEDARQQEYNEAGRARLAMTPGVAGSREFHQFGRDYSFDPMQAGRESGLAEGAEDVARQQMISQTPGLSPRAARIIAGRSGVVESQGGTDPMHLALANYIRQPSRETAARAIEAGAALNQFPDIFATPDNMQKPVPGSQADLEDFREKEKIRAEYSPSAGRASANADAAEERAAATDYRAKEAQAGATRREFQGVLSRRPRASQFVDPTTRQVDQGSLTEAARNWRADSTMTNRAFVADSSSAAGAQEYLRGLTGVAPSPASAPAVTAPAGPPAPAAAPASAPAPAGKKKPTAKMMADAAKDPEYRADLIARGFDLGGK